MTGNESGRQATETMIRASDLSVRLADTPVLDGIEARVDRGTLVGLIGPNGAGKTTLLRTINGALSPDAGEVEVAGERIHDLSSKEASRLVATVPQETSLSFDFDVRQTVEMGRTAHLSRFSSMDGEDRDIVDRAMERTAVASLADRPITEVSGGERSRVLLARALAQDTPVLLLDEPTASLDINHQLRTLELVRDLADEGKTVLAAIHDLNLAARYCDELLLLADGAILAHGPPAQVLNQDDVRSAFDASAAFARAPETGTRRVTALTDQAKSASGHVHVVGGEGRAARFLYPLVAAGYDVTVGPVAEGDPDVEAARQLDVDCLTLPPYSHVDSTTEQTLQGRLAGADAVLVADVSMSDGNLPVFDALTDRRDVVVVADRPFETRNHAGEKGRTYYETLCEQGHVADPETALDTLAEVVLRSSHSEPGETRSETTVDGAGTGEESELPPLSNDD